MSQQNNNLAKIEHIVVLMMENRSFDNVLGWLYGPNNPPPRNQTFSGVNSAMCNHRPGGGSGRCWAESCCCRYGRESELVATSAAPNLSTAGWGVEVLQK